MTPDPISLPESDRLRLLLLARRALAAHVRGEPAPRPEAGGSLDRLLGAFVTIHLGGELRGCLGRVERSAPLGRTVLELAQEVSHSDPRFPPVHPDELAGLAIEISVLEPERAVIDIADIDVGRHGLIVERGRQRGLLLPQVPVEHGWDRETFLEHVCLKAGLSGDAWREGAQLFLFEAEVFSDDAPGLPPAQGR